MEKAYYYSDGDLKIGPLSIEELRKVGLTPDVLVWRTGMIEWIPAGKLMELNDFFPNTPPPLPGKNHIKKKGSGFSSVVKAFSICSIVVAVFMGIFAVVAMNNEDKVYQDGDYIQGFESGWAGVFFLVSVFFIAFSIARLVNLIKMLRDN